MAILILGLVLFLGVHSTRIVADGWRSATIARIGEMPWKGIYSLLSIAGFALVIWGFRAARADTLVLYTPPVWARHLAALLLVASFILLVAAYVPRNAIKAKLHHPMVLGVKVWALAHLLANGVAADVVLFGAFLAWAVLSYRAARQRDRANNTVYPAGTASMTALTVVIGLVAWAAFAFMLHGPLIGVRPFG
ncbi:NnrU family protein [Ramlibacter sp. RBP-2]|uniref:NnrU family protein n=1 Tax=Ramlibacter lithotrophicus TaxID=2606681 RepID=A0A7X6DGK5_9BURK|nr:NnrU family protein [Ramlibacter lithotrophicus]NKE66748.1 NnrU family protein [Ramlibacter lithotrophicus]